MIEYDEILELAEAQKEALLEGRLEKAVELQARRQKIIDKIQNVDREATADHLFNPSTGKNDPVMEEFSAEKLAVIEKILSVDKEMQSIIYTKLVSISKKLDNIHKLRAFCHNAAPYHPTGKLNINV